MSRRTLRRLVPFVVLTVVFAALLYRAEHKAESGISQVDRHITEVTSPCLRYGSSSPQCKHSFEAALATLTHPEACAVERKAGTLAAIRALALALRQLGLDVSFSEPCAGARLAQERQRSNERGNARRSESSTATAPPEGGGATSAPTGHSLPGPHGSGGASVSAGGGSHGASAPGKAGSHAPPVPGEGGSEAAPAPGTPAAPAPTAPASPGTSSPPTTEPPTETPMVEGAAAPEAPVRQGAGALLESVGGVVEGLDETVGGTVEGVESTTCSLAKLLCHE
jgi:hypothetical protein